MKIGFFMQNVRKGGLDTFVINLLRHWPSGHELTLFCNSSHPGLPELRSALAPRVQVVAYDFLVANDLDARVAGSARPLRVALKGMFWLLGMPWMRWRARRLFREHDCERLMVINGGYPGGDACLAATLAWADLGHAPAWHNFHNLTLPYPANRLRRAKERWVDRLVARSSAGFVTVSAACLDTLRHRPLLLNSQRRYIHNGMAPLPPPDTASLRAELGLPESARLVLMLAVYEERKGHAFLFEAMREVVARDPEAHLMICGDGSPAEMERVQRLREHSPCRERIILQGHRHDVSRLLAQADVLAIPSQAQESFGYTAVEAMLSRLPVVATDVGGLPEVVEHGRTGLIIDRNDAAAFGRALAELLSDPARRQACGEAGRMRALECFSIERMSGHYLRLFE